MEEKRNLASDGSDAPRVGIYICHCGGNISDHVDVEVLCEKAEKIPGVAVARRNMFMCSDPGQELIMEDIRSGKVNRIVVASCSPSLHEMTFRSALERAGANPYVYEHANIREQVSWVHHGEPATEKAFQLISAAAAKARLLEPLEPLRVEARRHATVIGAGIAGLRAAVDLADRGFQVALLEKTPFAGGRVARLDRLAPTGEAASEAILSLARRVMEHPAITFYPCAQVVGFDGYVGNFSLELQVEPPAAEDAVPPSNLPPAGDGEPVFVPSRGVLLGPLPTEKGRIQVETGVVVLATGFKPYTPRKGEYGYGELPEVMTLPQFIEALRDAQADGSVLMLSGRPIRSIAMIHCVGSRQIPGIHEEDASGYLNEYCSRTCCSATLFAANQVRTRYPETRVFEFYRDIRAYGRGQEELYQEAARNKVLFLRFEPEDPPRVERSDGSSGTPLVVRVKDALTFGEEVQVPADLVVLAVGMEPTGIQDLVDLMKLPVGADRFLLEVHPKLRPVELATTGLLLAGTCQAPMDVSEACNAASAAASKAASLLAKGYVQLDPFVAEVDMEKCQGTGSCVEACLADGAIELVDVVVNGETVRRARVVQALCLGCGACVAACPSGAIQVKGSTLAQFEAMVDAIASHEAA
ncbi:heterodisulfide reductase subunit A [Desulfacinum hydrothermale DSM 13146]|uniref:Heterodisulfide reductase subunit A n=1 Tax=Desulfacinum hydrothermale DSM 13146 TaxID=1121390 RepID=A0A1W1XNE0_9BACT|nr:CoB--CoM heterodisulfide reductase iron-sulfur subunit A family protein [Desulfacinum hydrothermale]SMC25490.1 heterodisulfide reductase subunit A [Desulfacinum hydrothermale DSM 13146]